MSNIATPSVQDEPRLSLVSKLLPVWIILAMAIGLLLGQYLPSIGKALEPAIPLGLFIMIFPAMTKLELGQVRGAVRDWKPAAVVIFFNYFFNPFLLYFFGWLFLAIIQICGLVLFCWVWPHVLQWCLCGPIWHEEMGRWVSS